MWQVQLRNEFFILIKFKELMWLVATRFSANVYEALYEKLSLVTYQHLRPQSEVYY